MLGTKVFSLEQLERAVVMFTAHAAAVAKLRQQASLANCLQVFPRTSLFSPGDSYSGSRIIALPYSTDNTRDLFQAAIEACGRSTGLAQPMRRQESFFPSSSSAVQSQAIFLPRNRDPTASR
ncbi:hypothetical protein ACFSHR_01160 [Azotobacter chroococcum]